MKKQRIFLVVFVLILLFGYAPFAKSEPLDQFKSQIDTYIKNKQWTEAEETIGQALEIAKEKHGGEDPESAKLLNSLMLVYFMKEDYLKAESTQKKIIDIMRKTSGPENFDIYMSLLNLKKINEKLGQYEAAEDYHRQALELGVRLISRLIKDPQNLQKPKILDFIPTLYTSLPLTLALPDSFTVMPDNPDFNLLDGVFWGEKETLEALGKSLGRDFRSIDTPIFRTRFSTNVYQTGENQFSGEERLKSDLEQAGLKNVKLHKTAWGHFPVLTLEGDTPEGKKAFMAWVGMNNPYNKQVLTIEYHYPTKDNLLPSLDHLQIWNDFIEKTAVLPEPVYSKVQGYDYQKGYTIVTRRNAKFKISVQLRKRDGKYAVSVKNLGEYIFIDFEDFQGPKGGDDQKPITLALILTIYENTGTTMLHESVKIIPEKIDEFNFSGSLVRDFSGISVYSESEVSSEPRLK